MAEIIVVGGGIGGLATAVSMAGAGHRVTVLERNETFAELGAGIQLAPNGIHALERLGLGEQVRRIAVHIDELRFMDGVTDRHVVSLPLTGQYRRRFQNPYVVVHRGELYRLLLESCRASPAVTLHGGRCVDRYEQDGATAAVVTRTGERYAGDAVIGADGIHSAVRDQLVGDGEPRVSGLTVYRAIVPIERVPDDLRWNAVTWWAGPGCHFVHYPIANGRYLNLAASSDNGATEAHAGVPQGKGDVRREFAGLGDVPHRLLELGEDWKSWVLIDRDPVATWTDGRVTLLGDAAHPMLHYAAQGACQALEDAVLLGDLLRGPGEDPAAAFRGYNEQRRHRTAAITYAARESTKLWHPAGADARARNAMLAGMSVTDLHDAVAWMHGVRDFGRQEASTSDALGTPAWLPEPVGAAR
jgi:2-polyprenyl-6-methoxyphenol hydroxylase-like FAD-dependent oxidoreductase